MAAGKDQRLDMLDLGPGGEMVWAAHSSTSQLHLTRFRALNLPKPPKVPKLPNVSLRKCSRQSESGRALRPWEMVHVDSTEPIQMLVSLTVGPTSCTNTPKTSPGNSLNTP